VIAQFEASCEQLAKSDAQLDWMHMLQVASAVVLMPSHRLLTQAPAHFIGLQAQPCKLWKSAADAVHSELAAAPASTSLHVLHEPEPPVPGSVPPSFCGCFDGSQQAASVMTRTTPKPYAMRMPEVYQRGRLAG
jgi:hypothetical protein